MKRAVAAGAAFAAASGSGVVAALVAARPSLGLWVALGVLVTVGAALQSAVTATERRRKPGVLASGAGAVAVGGSAREVRTYVRGAAPGRIVAENSEVTASDLGSVAVGGDVTGPVVTDVASVRDDPVQ